MGWEEPLTHRQFLAWQEWLNLQWNEPDRTDHYLMQVSYDIRRVNAKNPSRVKYKDTRITFKDTRATAQEQKTNDTGEPVNEQGLTKEQVSAISKARWFGMMTRRVRIIDNRPGKSE